MIQLAPRKWPARAGNLPGQGCRLLLRISAKGPVSRILSCAVIPLGAALPRTLISDLPGGFGVFWSLLNASGRCAAPPGSLRLLPSLFGLAPCGVYPAPALTDGAVRSYRTISPLPRRGLAVQANLSGLSGMPCYVASDMAGVAEAVSFLWHWPSTGLEARVPDVIRHTALRSSDFPPPASAEAGPAATARSSCLGLVYQGCGLPVAVGDFRGDNIDAARRMFVSDLNIAVR